MKRPLVVTVIPNWNLKKDLGECLDSLQNQTYSPLQVVVVDNGSSDGSPEFIERNYPEIKCIALPENRGYAGALNEGIKLALDENAEYILALNNDTIANPDAVNQLVSLLEGCPEIGIASPKVLYYDRPKRIYRLGDRRYSLLPMPLGFGNKWYDHPRYSGVMDFDYVSGCAMLIRARLFRQIGLFDPGYFMYYEDSDFCRRARDNGHRIVCVCDAIIYHKASLSARKEKAFITEIRARNRARFYHRYRHGPHPWLTFAAIGIMAIWRAIGYLVNGQGELIKPYLRGLFKGWRESILPHQETVAQSNEANTP
jgi:GT2 family glycosyltransferase